VKKQLPYFLIAFALPVTAMLWWWGLFSSASVGFAQSGGYHYVYLEATGAYSKLSDKQNEVLFYLKQQGIEHGAEITLVLTDPRTTPYKDLQARTGYVVDKNVQVKAPLLIADIPAQQVVLTKIKAHPLLAYGKTYSELLNFTKTQNIPFHLPTIEIYNKSVLSVEMPLIGNQMQKNDVLKSSP
jgi:effector-binding domain-containing protein